MASTAKIVELRNLLRERFPAAHQDRRPEIETCPTGLPCLDDAGLPKGALTELVSPQKSGGSALLLRRLIENLAANGQYLALVDGRDSFDPQSVEQAACDRLLWVRCHNAKETVQAADILLRDGNLPFAVIDLQFNPEREIRRLPGQTWYRLQTLVAKTNATCLILTPSKSVSAARLRLTMNSLLHVESLERQEKHLLKTLQLDVTRRRDQVAVEPEELDTAQELAG